MVLLFLLHAIRMSLIGRYPLVALSRPLGTFWVPLGLPIISHLAAIWLAIGSQLAPKWLPDSKRNS